MNSKDIVNMLDNIKELLNNKEYEEIMRYIETAKINIMATENALEDYIEDVVSALK